MMIDINKPVRTRGGLRVINLKRVECISTGEKATFPIKGTIIVNERPRKTEYCIWTDEGQYSVLTDNVFDIHN